MPPSIDIIIPVYNACADLNRCIDSVKAHTTLNDRIYLIDDCSPDPAIRIYFDKLEAEGDTRFTLLRNDENLGFVKTVNQGMSLTDNDVVLLNSDTLVTRGWLDKIARCAASNPSIGTITPFSNNAEICSFPLFCVNNPMPDGFDADAVNSVIEAAAIPVYPEIPTAVGFCMYIRRTLINAIGVFDAATFALGYGEENDFCRRAVNAGWRNVLCDDTFIAHVGGSSFDSKKQALAEQNLKRLIEKHPDYQDVVSKFILADPIKPMRALALTRMSLGTKSGTRPGILHIMHGSNGGTEQHIQQLIRHGDGCYRHYVLLAVNDDWTLIDTNSGYDAIYRFTRQQDQLWADLLEKLCGTFNIELCHLQHLAHCRPGLLAALEATDIPYGITIHDFFLACPTVHLLDDLGMYCGAQTSSTACQMCLSGQDQFAGIDIGQWRSAHASLIAGAQFVLAPSQSAADTFTKYFPGTRVDVVHHGIETTRTSERVPPTIDVPEDDKHNIGVLGAIGPVKGARILERLLTETRRRRLPLRWIVVGYTDTQFNQHRSEDGLLLIHGQYDPKDMPGLLQKYAIKLVVFPSAGPETYCYTLSEAWSCGVPVLVPAMGALEERVTATGAGWIMRDWQNIDLILDDVMKIVQADGYPEYQARQQSARSVRHQTIAGMVAGILTVYGRLELKRGSRLLPRLTATDLLAAAGNFEKTMDVEALAIPAQLSWWGRFSLFCRKTFLGKWLVALLPLSLKLRLRRVLLNEVH